MACGAQSVYVGNLPASATEAKLKEVFEGLKCEVPPRAWRGAHSRAPTLPQALACPRYVHDGEQIRQLVLVFVLHTLFTQVYDVNSPRQVRQHIAAVRLLFGYVSSSACGCSSHQAQHVAVMRARQDRRIQARDEAWLRMLTLPGARRW